MRCEWDSGCTRRAKLQLSVENGWKARYCFAHAYKMLKPLIKQVHRWNRGLYIQKVPEHDD